MSNIIDIGTRTEVSRTVSYKGDVILTHDQVDRGGELIARHIVMFTPSAEAQQTLDTLEDNGNLIYEV